MLCLRPHEYLECIIGELVENRQVLLEVGQHGSPVKQESVSGWQVLLHLVSHSLPLNHLILRYLRIHLQTHPVALHHICCALLR